MTELKSSVRDSIRHGEFTLSSGLESDRYVESYYWSTRPLDLKRAAKQIDASIRELEPDRIAGVSMGGVPLAIATALEGGYNYLIVRDSGVEGYLYGGDVVLIEDVVTTGGSAIRAAGQIMEFGGEPTDVVAVVYRDDVCDGRSRLREAGLDLHELYKMTELEESGEDER